MSLRKEIPFGNYQPYALNNRINVFNLDLKLQILSVDSKFPPGVFKVKSLSKQYALLSGSENLTR